MKHLLFNWLLSAIFFLLPITLSAEEFIVNGIKYSTLSNTTVEVISKGGYTYSGDIVIPAQVEYNSNVYIVNRIAKNAFLGCYISSITIPKSVMSIEEGAFRSCNSLTSIVLPNDLKVIGQSAFAYCTALAIIDCPESVERIGWHAFENTAWLNAQPDGLVYAGSCLYCYKGTMPENTHIDVKEGTKYIAASAFPACTGLKEITIPNSVTFIDNYAFYGCSELTTITLGEGLTDVGSELFGNCSKLNEIVCYAKQVPVTTNGPFPGLYNTYATMYVPASLYDGYKQSQWKTFSIVPMDENTQPIRHQFKIIGDDEVALVARDVAPYRGVVEIPATTVIDGREYRVTCIGDEAFYYCRNIVDVAIPNSVKKIGKDVFNGCSLTSLELPEGVTTLDYEAIYGCNSLVTVSLPSSLTDLGDNNSEDGMVHNVNFHSCRNLTSITVAEGNPVYDSRNNCNAIIETATNKLVVGCKGTKIPSNIKIIGCGAFANSPLQSIEIPTGVEIIDDGAFANSDLVSMSLPEGLKSINYRTFFGCTKLTSLNIPEGVTSIGEGAFSGCNSLSTINLPESVTTIGGYAFSSCSSLKTINLPNNLSFISQHLFSYCSSLTSINIPEYVSIIGDDAFSSCSSLTSINIPESVTSIGKQAFDDCSSLKSVTIPGSVTSIGSQAFSGCSNLTSINIQEGVSIIGEGAFMYCSTLAAISIPASVTDIGISAFHGCKNLTSITVATSNSVYDSRNNSNALIETSSNMLLTGCQNTVIPETVTAIGNSAFFECNSLKTMVIPNNVTSIGSYAFYGCKDMNSSSINIPKDVTSIGDWAFWNCYLMNVYSYIENPFAIGKYVFGSFGTEIISKNATLYVPAGTKEKYETTEGWNIFPNIVEMDVKALDEDETIDFSEGGIGEETKLDGNIVGNLFFNISNENGSYNVEEGCIVINNSTSDEEMAAIENKEFFDSTLREQFTGIIFKVPAGKGKVQVTAETTGNIVLKVKIGDSEPIEMELEGKQEIPFSYNVNEDSYVYIYAGENSVAGVKGYRAPGDAVGGSLKIYGIEWNATIMPGDANNDGKVSIADVTAVINRINGQQSGIFIEKAANVNGDEKISIADVTGIINIINKK